MDITKKKCTGPCGRILPQTDEFFSRGRRGKHIARCKDCKRKQCSGYKRDPKKRQASTDAWRKRNPERVLELRKRHYYAHKEMYRDSHFKRLYGLSLKEYDAARIKQNGVCAICKGKPDGRLHVDHDHETKAFRGLLCSTCNGGLGMFKDDAKLLSQAISYLVENTCNKTLDKKTDLC